MKLFRRGSKPSESAPVPRHEDLVMISDDDLAPVIDGLTSIVVEGMNDFPFDDETLGLLQVGLPYLTQRECSDDAVLAGQTAARLGYLARSAEFAKFNTAREADLGLLDALHESLSGAQEGQARREVMAEFAAAMVRSENLDPTPDEGGPSWALPGIGGAARSTLRDHLLAGMQPPDDVLSEDLKRVWKYGYFLRALEEFFFEEGMQH